MRSAEENLNGFMTALADAAVDFCMVDHQADDQLLRPALARAFRRRAVPILDALEGQAA